MMLAVKQISVILVVLVAASGFSLVAWASSPAAPSKEGADTKASASAPAEEEKEGKAGEHHPKKDPSPLAYDPDLAIFTAIIFLLLLAVLGKFAWGPIIESLDQRENSLADKLEEADRHQREAKALLAEYEKKLAAASVLVDEMITKGRREAELQAQKIVDEAAEAARSEKARVVAAIEAAKENALRELAEKSVDTAFGLATKVLSREIRPAEHTQLVAEALSQFPGKQGA